MEVIADAGRRRILDEMRHGEQPVSALVERLAMSQPAVSKQLRILREAGLVTVRPDGQRRLYRVRHGAAARARRLAGALPPDVAGESRLARGAAGRGSTVPEEEAIMSEGTLLTAGTRPVLRFERHLPRPPDAAWRAVTDPVEMRAWFPTRIEIGEWRVGARLTHHFDQHDVDPLPGTVLEWDPPRRVRFTWGSDTISFELAPAVGGGTLFVLTEELDANHAARNAAGWDGCLDRLQGAEDRDTWRTRFERYAAGFEPVLGPQDGPPEGVEVDG